MFSWITIGSLDVLSVMGATVLSVGTTLALWAWAKFIAKGRFGPFQEYLGHISIPMVPVFAIANAVAEEVEYRGIIMAALFGGDTSGFTLSWEKTLQIRPLCLIFLQATLFAMEHYHAGFPSGKVGFVMVFIWGSLLGVLRLYTNGMFLPLAVHIVADTVIGLLLVFRQRKILRSQKKPRKR
jgi:membrane protease YdiL (CAAX protease family)